MPSPSTIALSGTPRSQSNSLLAQTAFGAQTSGAVAHRGIEPINAGEDKALALYRRIPACLKVLTRRLPPATPPLLLHADTCRAELQVEIEGDCATRASPA